MPMPIRGSMPPMYGPEPVYYEDPQYEYVSMPVAPAPMMREVQYVEMPPPPPQPVYLPPPPPPPQPVYLQPVQKPLKPVAPTPQGNSCRCVF